MAHHRRQHLVSRVVIARFSDQGQVMRFEFDSGKLEPRSPATCMYMPLFISAAPAAAEQLWGSVENRLPAALAAVDDASILSRPDCIATIKDCIAMHLARSKGMAWTREESLQRAAAKLKVEMMTNHRQWLLDRFRRRYGVVGVGFQAMERAADDFIEQAAPLVNTAETFWASVRELFELFKAFFGKQQLEIASPESGEFLLGDFPAVALPKSQQPLGGPRWGVPVDEAATVVMPLGPKHLVGLGPAPRFESVFPADVDKLNQVQAMNAFHEVCFRPGASLDAFVTASRAQLPTGARRTPLSTP